MSEKEIIKCLREIFAMEDAEPDAGILFMVRKSLEDAAKYEAVEFLICREVVSQQIDKSLKVFTSNE